MNFMHYYNANVNFHVFIIKDFTAKLLKMFVMELKNRIMDFILNMPKLNNTKLIKLITLKIHSELEMIVHFAPKIEMIF